MADGQIRIRIGAVQDRSFETVFGNVEKRIGKLQDTARKALAGAGGGNALAKPMQQAATAADKASRDIERSWNRQLRELNRIAKAQDQIFTKGARDRVRAEERSARERVRIEERANREIERSFREASRAADREMRRQEQQAQRAAARQERIRQRFAERTSYRATHFLFPPPTGMLGAGRRVAGDILRGAGVDFSVAGSVQRAVGLNTSAIQLANQERIATGSTRGAKFYENLARQTADATHSDPAAMQALASRFAARTGQYGNLDQIVPQLASLAKVSGADPDQIGSAAGMVFQQMKDQPDAIAKTIEVMRTIIGQSAEGAVDMPDYASQLGRIAAGAFKFTGDRGRNIAALSALTQLSMERGATSAADAARSTGSFVSTLGKGARLAQFEEAGVRVYTDDTLGKDGKVVAGDRRTTLRPLEEIIKDSFEATGGNIPQLGKMYMDVLGRKGVESLGAVYQGAGGGDAGIAAIQAEFDRYMRATISKDVEDQNMRDIADSPAAKAQRFQNNLDKIAASMADKVLPAMEKLAPLALDFVSAFGGVIKFTAEFPIAALAVAASLAVLRAAVESSARAMLEQAILARTGRAGGVAGSVAGAAGGGAIVGAGGGRMMTGMKMLGGAATGGLAGAAVGELLGDTQMGTLIGAGGGAGMAFGPLGAVIGASAGAVADQALKLRSENGGWDFWNGDERANEQARAAARAEGRQFVQGAGDKNGIASGAAYDAMMGKAREQGMLDPVAISRAFGDQLSSQTLSVRVTNLGDIPRDPASPKVDPSGRQPAPGMR